MIIFFKNIGKNAKLLWNVVNGLIKKFNNKTDIIEMLCGEHLYTQKSDICNGLNEDFVNAGLNVQSSIKRDMTTNFTAKNKHKKAPSSMKFRNVTEGHICKIVAKMKPKTSYGYDDISNVLLKNLISVIKSPLCILINKSLSSGTFPDLIIIAKVIPLHKGGELNISDNYRPISLLPVLSKVIEKIVYEQVVWHLDANSILFPKQFGFRRGHCTVDAVSALVGEILNSFEKNMMVLSVFIDLRKAFDSISHDLIIKKLEELGIRGTERAWFEDYLRNRKQFVMIDDTRSNQKILVLVCVPQGSLLGVLLFQLFINSVNTALRFSSCILYADDTTIYVIGRNLHFLRTKMNANLNSLSVWLSQNNLKLNVKKTRGLLFHKDGLNPDPGLMVNGEPVIMTTEFQFLGILLDNQLSFLPHYKNLYSKLNSSCFIVRSLVRVLPTMCLRTLYFGFFNSHLSYGLTIWWPMLSNALQDKLIKIQKRIVRGINKSHFRDHCMPLFKKCHILTIADQVKIENCKIMYKLDRGLLPVPMQNLYKVSPCNYNTRCTPVLVPLFTSTKANRSFLCKPITEWGNLPNEVKNKASLKLFVKTLKTRYLKLY